MLYCNLDEAYSNSASFSTSKASNHPQSGGNGDNATLKGNYHSNGVNKMRSEDEEYAAYIHEGKNKLMTANTSNMVESVPTTQQLPQGQTQNSQLAKYPVIHNDNKRYMTYQNPHLQSEDLGLSYGLGSEDETIIPIRRRKRSHPYYINKFLNSFTDDDLMSLASNYDNDMYQHIVSCKYCRMKINYEMKKRFLNELTNANKNNNMIASNNIPIMPMEQHLHPQVNSYQIQHFDPNVKGFVADQSSGRMSNVVNTLSPMPQQQVIQTPTQQIKEDSKYDHYLMIIVVIVLILFLLVDIVLKIVK